MNAALHGRKRVGDGRVCHLNTVDPDDIQTGLLQVLDIALLMGRAAFRQDLQKWVPDLRLRQRPFGHCAIQGREVMAV